MMYKNVLASIPGIEWYPIVALIFFFGFFTALIIWYFRADQARLVAISRTILDDETKNSDSNSTPTILQRS